MGEGGVVLQVLFAEWLPIDVIVVVVVIIFGQACLHMSEALEPGAPRKRILCVPCGMPARNQFALLTHDWILLIQFAATLSIHVLCMPSSFSPSLFLCACVC